MRVCIIGGGKLGYYLAKTLHEHGHLPIIIERDASTCARIADELDMPVIHGDGTKPEMLAAAELGKCHALVAVTGQDENNLIACELAKQVHKVRKTVARVNNPKNAPVLKALGVDIVVSSTDNIARLIEREVETAAMCQLLSLAGGTASLTEINIPDEFEDDGKTLAQMKTPSNMTVVSVTRGDQFIIPNGETRIHVGDKVMVLASNETFPALAKAWRLREK